MVMTKNKFIYAFIIVFLTFAFIALGVISLIAPTAKAIDSSLPYGDLVQGYDIKNLSVIENAFVTSGKFESTQSFSKCGYFAWVTHDITVTDQHGWGNYTYDDFVVVCLFCPENANTNAEIGNYQGNQYFGVDNPTVSNPYSPPYWKIVIGTISGSGKNQTISYSKGFESFNYDNAWDFPLNSSDKPLLYYNFPSLVYGIPSEFSGKGEITSYGSIDSISSAGLLSELYDISFVVQGVSDNKHSSLISRSLEVTPLAVLDDTGYNMIYLEVPQLGTKLYHNDVIWGYYLFKPRYTTDRYYFNKLKLSFAYDPLNDSSDLSDFPADSFFELSVNSKPVKSSGVLTVNSMSFLFGGSVHSYNNRELNIYDYSSDSNNLYPTFMFHSIATCNRYSAGSFCYNFVDSGLIKVDDQGNATPATPEDKDDLGDKGDDRNRRKKEQLGFVPRNVRFNTLNDGFSWDNSQEYDFSSVGSLLGSLFSNSFILTIATACCVVGLIGYVLYGKN